MGGGTFDIPSRVGGGGLPGQGDQWRTPSSADEDFDMRISEHLAEEFRKESGIDLRKDRLALQASVTRPRKGQDRVSAKPRPNVQISVHSRPTHGPKHSPSSSAGYKLEALVTDLIRRPIETLQAACADAGLQD